MSHFMESSEYDPERFEQTDFGFVLRSEDMPRRKDVLWKKMPEGDIYFWDDQEWRRMSPPERKITGDQDLKHG